MTQPLDDIIGKIDGLPTIPAVSHRVGELIHDPRADARAIAALLRSDQSLTAKVLKLANSAYYGIPGGVTDVTRAISFLGFNTLYQLVLSVSVFSVLRGSDASTLDIRELWKHSLGCGLLAERIAAHLGIADTNVCFTGGLLHDIGKVALLQVAPARFVEAVALARAKSLSMAAAATECGLPTHVAVGSRLAERWRFPMPLRVAIAHQRYQAPEARQALAANLAPFADIAALANVLCRRFGFGDPGDPVLPEVDPALLERLNLTTAQIDKLKTELLRAAERSKVMLDLMSSSA
ncbi:MAG: HDOD domain-containing protein [Deltaproteobacteria bacterium]|nr:HDOD domain-containing protein [Deltaproteobacteria bacterium]